jgi:hypothetical protein
LKERKIYKAFGLNISSQLAIPEIFLSDGLPDVEVKFGSVPESLEHPLQKAVFFEADQDTLLLKIPNVAHFLIRYGNEITIDPASGTDDDSIRLFLLGSSLGALLLQRGILPLHGSVIHINDSAVVFTGNSGSGKSTLAATFVQKGHSLISDDIAAIGFLKNVPYVMPGIAELKLRSDTLEHFKIESFKLNQVKHELNKFRLPAAQHREDHVPVTNIYILNTGNNGGIELKPTEGIEKFMVLKNQTYRNGFVKGLDLQKEHFDLINKLVAKVKVCNIFRNSNGFSAEAIADAVLEDLNKKNFKE